MKPLKRTLIEFLIGLPVVIGLSILMDCLYQTIITHSTYVFSFKTSAFCAGVWVIIEIITYVTRSKKQNNQ